MATADNLAEYIEPFIAPLALFRLLEEVPEFTQVRLKLATAHSALWERIDLAMDAIASNVTPNTDVRVLRGVEDILNSDAELTDQWGSYIRGLKRVAKPLGSPANFIETMAQHDANIRSRDRLEILSTKFKPGTDFREPGTIGSWVNQLINQSIASAAGVDSMTAFFDRRVAAKGRARAKKLGRDLRHRLIRPDPLQPIGYWVGVKALGFSTRQIAAADQKSDEWVQDQIQAGTKLLKAKPTIGRPRKNSHAAAKWSKMRFKKPA